MSLDRPALQVRLAQVVHPGLSLLVELRMDREIGVLFGPSGAGKSTILRLIAGLIRPQMGLIRMEASTLFDTRSGTDVALRNRRIGLIFQDDLLFPHLSVRANVRFGLDRWARKDADARVAEIAELCGIGRLLDRDPRTLSGGERQRVGLARALAPRPRLLLCDEPLGALDLDARQALIERIKQIQRLERIPILYVTHSTDEAVAIGDRLFLLSEGQIVASGPPLDVLSSRFSSESIQVRNVFEALIETNPTGGRETTLQIVGGPTLVVPRREGTPGERVRVTIDADEIVLAQGAIGPISARNLLDGIVERVVVHGLEAEVLVRTGGVVWVVGVLVGAVGSLGLIAGSEVRMIIKSRSCRVVRDELP